jgi:hypothetical protein
MVCECRRDMSCTPRTAQAMPEHELTRYWTEGRDEPSRRSRRRFPLATWIHEALAILLVRPPDADVDVVSLE